jgi:hypothetical protein
MYRGRPRARWKHIVRSVALNATGCIRFTARECCVVNGRLELLSGGRMARRTCGAVTLAQRRDSERVSARLEVLDTVTSLAVAMHSRREIRCLRRVACRARHRTQLLRVLAFLLGIPSR